MTKYTFCPTINTFQKYKGRVAAKRTSAPTSGQHGRQSRAPLGRARSGRVSQRGRVRENGNLRRRKQQPQQPKPKGVITDDGDDQGPVKPPSPWRNSKARKKLAALLKDEASWVQVCDGYHVYHADEDFRKYNLKNFENNFSALKEKIQTDKEAVEFDKLRFVHDRNLHPASTTNKRGDKRYEGSAAERKLKQDVNAGKSKGRLPKEMWLSDPVYYEYLTLKQFRSHKYQEERSLTEKVYWQKKRNEKARKEHEKQAAKLDD